MTIYELSLAIDAAIQQAIGVDGWHDLNVWVTCRSMRLQSARWDDPVYSIEVHHDGETTRIDRSTTDEVFAAFQSVTVPRIKLWFGSEVAA